MGDLPIAAGILAALAIVLVPLATWALQSALGLWPPGGAGEHFRAYHTRIDWRWVTLAFWGGLSLRESDSEMAKLAYLLINVALVAAGIWWQRNEARLSEALRDRRPPAWRELLATRHESMNEP